jgi:hypothetical protein
MTNEKKKLTPKSETKKQMQPITSQKFHGILNKAITTPVKSRESA